jgi:ATP-dependent RNA helicase DBP3
MVQLVQTPEELERAARKAARKAAKKAAKLQAAAQGVEESASSSDGMKEENKKEKKEKTEKKETKEKKEKKREREEDCEAAPPKKAAGDVSVRKAFLKEHRMTMEGNGVEDIFPYYSFAEAQFPETAQQAIAAAGYVKPTPIQSVSWPVIMSGRDIIGVAETGSGKTMAFALPSLPHILGVKQKGIKVLVLAPTRELAMQTAAEYQKLNTKQVCLYGGAAKDQQLAELRKNPDVVIATPGRLIDFCDSWQCDLSNVSYGVLDEADRMLDTGFEIPVRKILGMLSQKRQMLMFTATWPLSVEKLASEFLKDPIKMTVGSQELTANVRVKQVVEMVQGNEKDWRLVQLLKKYNVGPQSRVIVFVLYKKDAPRVETMLRNKGYNVGALHGNSSQDARERTIEQFRTGQLPLMVATDVAARGLDIDDIEVVINYSMPLTIEDYIHRIGRTARAGKTGIAHSFFMHQGDRNLGWHLARVLREAGQPVLPDLEKYGPPAVKYTNEVPTCNISEVKAAPKITFDDSDDE